MKKSVVIAIYALIGKTNRRHHVIPVRTNTSKPMCTA